jgi:hypothetical protein
LEWRFATVAFGGDLSALFETKDNKIEMAGAAREM